MKITSISSDEDTAPVARRPKRSQESEVITGYRDYSTVDVWKAQREIGVPEPKRKGPRGGVVIPFPVKLHSMLSGVESEGLQSLVSWHAHGRCFSIHKPDLFVEKVMPKYFKQSKLTSFQRQLNLYGFVRLSNGRDRGAYYHELFLKSRPDLAKVILRTRVKGSAAKHPPSLCKEPNFYTMRPCNGFTSTNCSQASTKDETPTLPIESPALTASSSSNCDPIAPIDVFSSTDTTNKVPASLPLPPLAPTSTPETCVDLNTGLDLDDTSSEITDDEFDQAISMLIPESEVTSAPEGSAAGANSSMLQYKNLTNRTMGSQLQQGPRRISSFLQVLEPRPTFERALARPPPLPTKSSFREFEPRLGSGGAAGFSSVHTASTSSYGRDRRVSMDESEQLFESVMFEGQTFNCLDSTSIAALESGLLI